MGLEAYAGTVSTAAGPDIAACTEGVGEAACSTAGQPDLTWLLHRAAQRMRRVLDGVADAQGLTGGVRDWIVLSAVLDEPGRTQLALGHELGVDKSTLTSLLDRLEREGLVVRRADPRDRRARIPEVTARGREVQERVARERGRAEAEVLTALRPDESALLRDLLDRLASAEEAGPGSCM